MALSPVRVLPTLLAALALLGLLAATAPAAKAPVSPVVTSVAPLKLRIGEKLVVRGRGFLPGRRKNTVVFKRDGARAIFVKADRATRTELAVVIPDKLAAFLAQQGGKPQETTFRIRVLSRRFAKRFTTPSRSPRIGPAVVPPVPPVPPDCDKDGATDPVDLDDDNDLLADTAEAGFGTALCNPDTDGDGLRDHWEVESAFDLNLRAYFFPGKAPYPNPLWAGDANGDFDQDGLKSRTEHDLWLRSGGGAALTYSDGDQDTTTGPDPRTRTAPEQAHLEINRDGWLTDDEKDFDGDRLANWDETPSGRMAGSWWGLAFEDERPFFEVADTTLQDAVSLTRDPNRAPMYADGDIDGDQVPDGADDQDHDGYTNEQEVTRRRLERDLSGDGVMDHALRVNPYNPCLPDSRSRACTIHPPFGGSAWAPFDHEDLGHRLLESELITLADGTQACVERHLWTVPRIDGADVDRRVCQATAP
jgi:hypothetical protein